MNIAVSNVTTNLNFLRKAARNSPRNARNAAVITQRNSCPHSVPRPLPAAILLDHRAPPAHAPLAHVPQERVRSSMPMQPLDEIEYMPKLFGQKGSL